MVDDSSTHRVQNLKNKIYYEEVCWKVNLWISTQSVFAKLKCWWINQRKNVLVQYNQQNNSCDETNHSLLTSIGHFAYFFNEKFFEALKQRKVELIQQLKPIDHPNRLQFTNCPGRGWWIFSKIYFFRRGTFLPELSHRGQEKSLYSNKKPIHTEQRTLK